MARVPEREKKPVAKFRRAHPAHLVLVVDHGHLPATKRRPDQGHGPVVTLAPDAEHVEPIADVPFDCATISGM